VNEPSTDDRLRDALQALADGVPPAPDDSASGDYRRASAGWRRRYRRRRLVLAVLIAVVFLAADAIALWALNRTNPDAYVIFPDPRPAVSSHAPVERVGQP
jgi:ferric-dicitrate binding protein FerR (iron transport regulator)